MEKYSWVKPLLICHFWENVKFFISAYWILIIWGFAGSRVHLKQKLDLLLTQEQWHVSNRTNYLWYQALSNSGLKREGQANIYSWKQY